MRGEIEGVPAKHIHTQAPPGAAQAVSKAGECSARCRKAHKVQSTRFTGCRRSEDLEENRWIFSHPATCLTHEPSAPRPGRDPLANTPRPAAFLAPRGSAARPPATNRYGKIKGLHQSPTEALRWVGTGARFWSDIRWSGTGVVQRRVKKYAPATGTPPRSKRPGPTFRRGPIIESIP